MFGGGAGLIFPKNTLFVGYKRLAKIAITEPTIST